MNRRAFFFGASATILAAPAIVRVASLMPVKVIPPVEAAERIMAPLGQWIPCDGRMLSKAAYPDLYAVLGDTYGNNGECFSVPNLTRYGVTYRDADGKPYGNVPINYVINTRNSPAADNVSVAAGTVMSLKG